MKKLSIMALLLVAFLATNAQESKENKKDHFDKLVTELELNEEQAEQLKSILEERKVKMEEMKEERLRSAEEMKKKRMEEMKKREEEKAAMDEKISSILNEEQLAKFKKMQEEREARRMEMKEREHKPKRDHAHPHPHPHKKEKEETID